MGQDVRLIAWYASEGALAQTLSGNIPDLQGVNFQAHVGTLLEKVTVTPEKFKSIKTDLVPDTKGFAEEIRASGVEGSVSEAASMLLRKEPKMKVGELISLGVFDETPESISFCLLMKSEFTAPDTTHKMSVVNVLAQSHILVRNHLISVSCGTVFSKASDIELVRKNVKDWKDSILLSNKPSPP